VRFDQGAPPAPGGQQVFDCTQGIHSVFLCDEQLLSHGQYKRSYLGDLGWHPGLWFGHPVISCKLIRSEPSDGAGHRKRFIGILRWSIVAQIASPWQAPR